MIAEVTAGRMRFNGKYTIAGPRGHEVFRVKTQAADSRFFPGRRIVQVADSAAVFGWATFGVIEDDGTIRVFKSKQDGPYRAYGALLVQLDHVGEVQLPKGRYTLQLEKACVRCNRTLTHPESVESGVGPECSGRGYGDRKGRSKSVAESVAA